MGLLSNSSSAQRIITQKEVKLCELCGALNHGKNIECYTCGWHGVFSQDKEMIRLSWDRLRAQFEEVRIEHLTARHRSPLGEFGKVQKKNILHGMFDRVSVWWKGIRSQRVQRQVGTPTVSPTPPNELGV